MIRKITHISFALLLLIAAAGFSISKHYCHDQLVEVVVDRQAETCCDDGNCCRTETVLVQLDDDVVAKASVVVPDNVISQLVLQATINFIVSYTSEPQKVEFFEFISPPPPKLQTVLSCLQTYLL